MSTTTVSHERRIEPLLPEDLQEVRRLLGSARHRPLRSDHEGRSQTCSGCLADAHLGLIGLAGRARAKGWDRAQALAWVGATRTRRLSAVKDGDRSRRSDIGAASRPDVASKAKRFERVFAEAWRSGSLSQRPEIATQVLQLAMAFAGDPGERVTRGRTLPFDRMARTVVGATSQTPVSEVRAAWDGRSPAGAPALEPEDRVERLWSEIEVACGSDVEAAESLDRLVSRWSDRLSSHATLDRTCRPGTPVDELAALTPIWSGAAAVGADPAEVVLAADGPDPDPEPSPLVLGAVQRLRQAPRDWSAMAPDDREEAAAVAVMAEFAARHGAPVAVLRARPEVVELAREVVAEIGLHLHLSA